MSPTSERARAAARIKGAAVQDFYVWYAQKHGPARMEAIWAALPALAREELGPSPSKLMAFRWYSAPSIHALLDNTLSHHTEAQRVALARDGASVIVGQTLRGLYRAIFAALI